MATEPRWVTLARADKGIREVPGVANNPILVKRFASITKIIGWLFNADSIPWCGAIMAWWMNQCGIKPPVGPARALAWATWGVPLPKPILGSILVYSREGGGHVTMYVGESATHYFGLGGNQGDAITIAPFPKSRKPVAIRWPSGEPIVGGPVQLANAGSLSPVSEA